MLWMRFFWLGALRDGLAMIRNRFAGCLYLFIHPASEARFRSTGAVCPAPYPASAGGDDMNKPSPKAIPFLSILPVLSRR